MKQGGNVERVVGAFVSELYSCATFAALKATELGCILAWGRMILESGSATLPLDDASNHAVHFARLDMAAFQRMLNELRAMHLVATRGAALEVLPLSRALEAMQAESARRKKEWEKRRAVNASEVVTHEPVVGRPAATGSRPSVVEAAQASLLDTEPAPKSAEVDSIRRSPPQDMVRRFGASDKTSPDGDDPTQLRVHCEGGRTAEITASYVAHLCETFRGIDVPHQLRMASAWCESNPARRKTFTGLRRFLNMWLSNASREAEVRSAVVRNSKQANGFGLGGSYDAAAVGGNGRDEHHSPDDFADLFVAATQNAPAKTNRNC